MRARPEQKTALYLKLVREEAEKQARLDRVAAFFHKELGRSWRRVLHRRGVISEDSTARWVYRQQIPLWSNLHKVEDYAAAMGYITGRRRGRQTRVAPRRTVDVIAPQTAKDRTLQALSNTAQTLENRDIPPTSSHEDLKNLESGQSSVSITSTPSSLNKDTSLQLDFLTSLCPTDLQN
jgi:hypothetical protein